MSPVAPVSSPKLLKKTPAPPPPPPAGSMSKERGGPSASAGPGLGAVLSAINKKVGLISISLKGIPCLRLDAQASAAWKVVLLNGCIPYAVRV